ncbi:hypothetical protein DIZ27_23170 [Streptomyces sp. NWU339]|uniref:hypothetical protein n=1 Tax=Streptomyces sp. NWU339 TaxID=2185284 RepID=UPI000D679F6A|nr:hypothetical protein [Streptomyces sp. NWU339]PWI08342.1 hypothetical protein DIZ27_23170 [Streptomyces sp. NWU339]
MTIVTLGGVTVGICLLVHYLVTWWPGSKALRSNPAGHAGALLPFLLAWSYGVLTILGVGGLIGWAAGAALWISNWLGDVALVWGVGGAAGQSAGGAVYLPLTQTGGAIVLILTVGLVAAVKKSRYGSDLKRGAWCGICLGTSAGVAGFAAAPIAVAVNWLGDTVYGAL